MATCARAAPLPQQPQPSRRKNIIIHGLFPSGNGHRTAKSLRQDVSEFFTKYLHVTVDPKSVYVIRIGDKPILRAVLWSKWDKKTVFSNCHHLKGKGYRISDDWTYEEYLYRLPLVKLYHQHLDEGHAARINRNTLFVNGIKFATVDFHNRARPLQIHFKPLVQDTIADFWYQYAQSENSKAVTTSPYAQQSDLQKRESEFLVHSLDPVTNASTSVSHIVTTPATIISQALSSGRNRIKRVAPLPPTDTTIHSQATTIVQAAEVTLCTLPCTAPAAENGKGFSTLKLTRNWFSRLSLRRKDTHE